MEGMNGDFMDKLEAISGELRKPLLRENVMTRVASGSKLSYIEGWHAIDEANRIFGFFGWTRQTDCKMVQESETKMGAAQKPGYRVGYTAKVTIYVHGVSRDGVGFGQGIDADLGKAHESAIKEAETDATKRALMTFGYRFGLALYDKEQENVEEVSVPKTQPKTSAPQTQPPVRQMEDKKPDFATRAELESLVALCRDLRVEDTKYIPSLCHYVLSGGQSGERKSATLTSQEVNSIKTTLNHEHGPMLIAQWKESLISGGK
jgi:DNA repair and recombination protein RAD52